MTKEDRIKIVVYALLMGVGAGLLWHIGKEPFVIGYAIFMIYMIWYFILDKL